MRIIDLATSPWAIVYDNKTGRSQVLDEMFLIYSSRLQEPKIDFKQFKSQTNAPEDGNEKSYQVINGVAILELSGVLSKNLTWFSYYIGGTSTRIFLNDFRRALADPEVNSIILAIDSPGGTVDGTEELANAIYEARRQETKPIITFADGLMASAAYWIGAASDRIYINGNTAQVGSIGVVTTHIDYSQYESKIGIKTTEIYAGKYKRIDSYHAPLSEEAGEYLQNQVDYLYSIFARKVSQYRPEKLQIPEDGAISWADGAIFTGQQAIENGLVDGESTLEELIRKLSEEGKAAISIEKINEETMRRLQNGYYNGKS